MTARPLVPDCRRMPVSAAVALVLVVVAVMAAGCTSGQNNAIPASQAITTQLALTQTVTMSARENVVQASPIVVVNPNGAIEFSVKGNDFFNAECPNYIPLSGVEKITDTGAWVMLPEFRHAISIPVNVSGSKNHVPVYPINASGLGPGRYRIRLDCGGVSNEFDIWGAPGPVRTPCISKENLTPSIFINPLGSYNLGDTFEISGTTNVGMQERIRYTVSEPVIAYPGGWKSPDPRSTSGDVQVTDNGCDTQRWTIKVNSSEFRSCYPVLYLTVSTENGSIRNLSSFRIKPDIRSNYQSYTAVAGEPFIYHGTAPDSLPDIPATPNASQNAFKLPVPSITTVHVWLFGERYTEMIVIPVNPDKSFDVPLSRFPSGRLSNGTYRMLFQYPKSGDSFDITVKNGTYKAMNTRGIVFLNFYDIFNAKISGFKVMDMLEEELKKPESRDRYSIISLVISWK